MKYTPAGPLPARTLWTTGASCISLAFLGPRWGELPSEKAILCCAAAVILFVISLFLRGVLRILSLAIFLALAAGAFWLLREGWERRESILPPEWLAAAERELQSPRSQAAWKAIQAEFSTLSADARKRVAKTGEEARRALIARLEAKATDLRKSGNATEADELLRLRDTLTKRK
ncbi:MAG: hypothetical protein ABMA01_22410 [Chthoniobacteraceae bacterium]